MGFFSAAVSRRSVLGALGAAAATTHLMPVRAEDPSSVPAIVAGAPPVLKLTDAGTDLDRVVTIESVGLFRLVFEASDNWGLAQWYDLVNDPTAQTDLLANPLEVPGSDLAKAAEPGMFQQAFYGTDPDDPKLYSKASYHFFPNSPRAFNILENTASRIVVEAISSPVVNAVGILSNVTVSVTYHIYPNGRIYIRSEIRVANAQTVIEWRCAVLGLGDPTSLESVVPPDSRGWIRSSSGQNPYQYFGKAERYLYAYWSPNTPDPYTHWTKASIMLVPKPGNPFQGTQGAHNWVGFKRWYYGNVSLNMAAGEAITQHYFIQLGTQGSAVLPNINSSAAAFPIAKAYLESPTPPAP
jgi:hypothetical protein